MAIVSNRKLIKECFITKHGVILTSFEIRVFLYKNCLHTLKFKTSTQFLFEINHEISWICYL